MAAANAAAAADAPPKQQQTCQRIGCDAKFVDDDTNAHDACRFHPGPIFHDGGKEWSCCKQKSHDFSMFLELPGCQTGKHSTVKAQPFMAPVPKPFVSPALAKVDAASCSRCKQGFFCSDHGSKLPFKVSLPVKKELAKAAASAPAPVSAAAQVPPPKQAPKVVDLTAKQTCKNKGCGKSFTEKENTATSCQYHPGPAVFRDRQRGWGCCDEHVNDFDEFLAIPPCTTGWHNANPDAKGDRS